MINNKATGQVLKLDSVTGNIYEAKEGWSYSHHASIVYFKGKFWAMWSNGRLNEDDLGQRVMLAESLDGEHWENVRPIVTPEMLGNPKLVLTASGFYTDGDVLNVYYGVFGYTEDSIQWVDGWGEKRPETNTCHVGTDLGFVSTTDGITWTSPKSMGVPVVPNHGPQKTMSGRLIISGNMAFPYTDNPNAVENYHIAGIYGDAFEEIPFYDDSAAHPYVSKVHGWDVKSLCEGSFYQTDDGVLHMLLRSGTGWLWCSDSTDDGASWSEPYKTEYSDDNTKFHFGRLPDGRFYGVSSAKTGGGRNPLDLYLSKDGENFDKHYIIRDEVLAMKFPALKKNGLYGYPHTMIHDGFMYVIYSKNKEDIEVTKLSLNQL